MLRFESGSAPTGADRVVEATGRSGMTARGTFAPVRTAATVPPGKAVPHLPSLRAVPRRGLFVLMGLAVAAICAVFAVVVIDARSDARRAAETSELNLATALARDIDHTLERLDQSIQAARDAWSDPRVRALDPDLRRLAVFGNIATARQIDRVLIIDRNGAAVADSGFIIPRVHDFRDADFFVAQAGRDVGLFIGPPTKIPEGWRMALCRRLVTRDGTFDGVAVGLFDLDVMAEAYERLLLGRGGSLTLLNSDGDLVVSEPDVPDAIGRSFLGQATFDRMKVGPSGTFTGRSTLDGQSQLYAYQRIGSWPLIQSVAADTDAVYANWRAKAIALGAVLSLVCSGLLMLLAMLKRELAQRVAAETALDDLASKDHLTGLLNRRRFFELAEARCAEAAHQGLGLSLLMIDADHFKSYNDRYGHVAGDQVLAALGRCISGVARRSCDLAARYGGEEFIVLLPGTGEATAFASAEKIRTAVARLATPHDRTPEGIVTVSTGVACIEAGSSLPFGKLVEAADAELYRAKREGRNRSSNNYGSPAPGAFSATPGVLSA